MNKLLSSNLIVFLTIGSLSSGLQAQLCPSVLNQESPAQVKTPQVEPKKVENSDAASEQEAIVEKSKEVSALKETLLVLTKNPEIKNLVKENPDLLLYISLNYFDEGATSEVKSYIRLVAAHSLDFYSGRTTSESELETYFAKVDQLVSSAVARIPKKELENATQKGLFENNPNLNEVAKSIDPLGFYNKARGRAQLRQLSQFLVSVKTLKETYAREMSIPVLDYGLNGFLGFRTRPDIKAYQARPWENAQLMNAVSAQDVLIDFHEFLQMATIGLEVEAPFIDPSVGYPWETAMYFEQALPSVAEFVGKTTDEVEANKSCTRSWCAEERRHPLLWLNLLNRITGMKYKMSDFANNEVFPLKLDEPGVIAHLHDRMTSEIGASSTYVLTSTKVQGPTKAVIENMYRDELKHLGIFTTAAQYLMGYRPMLRRTENVKTLLGFLKMHKAERSAGSDLGTSNLVTSAEVVTSVIMAEESAQSYAATIPFITMRRLFESKSLRAEEPIVRSELDKAKVLVGVVREKIRRQILERWLPEQRLKYLAVEELIQENKWALENIIRAYNLAPLSQSHSSDNLASFEAMKAQIQKVGDSHTLSQFKPLQWKFLSSKMEQLKFELESALRIEFQLENPNLKPSEISELVHAQVLHDMELYNRVIPEVPSLTMALVREALVEVLRDRQISNNVYHQQTLSQASAGSAP